MASEDPQGIVREIARAVMGDACFAHLDSELRNPKLQAPSEEKLKEMLAAGKGEHQNRLFTLACKHAIEMFMEGVQERHRALHQVLDENGQPKHLS